MIHFRRIQLSAVGVILILASTLGLACGVERQSVKVGTDADIGKVNFNAPQNTTIANLRAFPTPGTIPANNRISPEETTVWVVDATLTMIKLESDQDYHLVIQDSSGNTMIAEVPAPSCVPSSSPMSPGVTNARAQVDAMINVTTSFQTVNVPVRVTGVGMHDFPHGQTGAAPNQIELHSVVGIVFNPGNATPDFALSDSPTSLSLTRGGSGGTTISTTATGGFNSSISLAASGLPAGVTATFNPGAIGAPGTGSSSLTLTASSTATTGATNITVTASGGGNTHTMTIPVTVTAAATPGFSVVAAPTSVSVTQGGFASSTISTTVSGGFNSAISLSTSTLPAGVTASFSPASISTPGGGSSVLTLTASGAAATGTTNVTVTASGGSVTHTATIALTIRASGGSTTQLIGNPGFENGKSNPAPWVLTTTHSSNQIIANSSQEPPNSGTFDAWLDGFGTATTDTIMQQVTIPANATAAKLSFWLHIDTAETTTTAQFDTLQVEIRDANGNPLQTLQTFSNLDHATGYQQQTYDLSSFIGQTIQVFLIGQEDFELQTSFVVDDFALNVTQ